MIRQKKQEFDSIADGHKAAMVAMGLPVPPAPEEVAPDCPSDMLRILDKYYALKFVSRNNTLYPREMLQYHQLTAYAELHKQPFTLLEVDLIMGLDALFEGRNEDE